MGDVEVLDALGMLAVGVTCLSLLQLLKLFHQWIYLAIALAFSWCIGARLNEIDNVASKILKKTFKSLISPLGAPQSTFNQLALRAGVLLYSYYCIILLSEIQLNY